MSLVFATQLTAVATIALPCSRSAEPVTCCLARKDLGWALAIPCIYPACPGRPRATVGPVSGCGWAASEFRSLPLLGQGEAQIAEPGTGDPDPFPAVRGLGSCSHVGQGCVQLGQFEAPLGSGVEISAGGGFGKEPFGFAVVIWTVRAGLFGRRPGRPWPGPGPGLTLT